MNSKMFSRVSVAALSILGAGLALGAKDKEPAAVSPPLHLQIDSSPINREGSLPVSYAPVVKRAAASVVNVYSSKKVQQRDMSQLFNDPNFRRFFGQPGQGGEGDGGNGHHPHSSVEQSLGSGVIISTDGYILTNNHVVDGADDVKVKFGQPEREYKATIIGRDPDADVAVLKINATGLAAATLGDSDQLQIGDTVLAVGDPFGVGRTVTHGIVSALGRNINMEAYEDFIQTDAPINPGNSGGALMDSSGRLVGINTAILSHSGGSNGIGFAIPINLVRSLAEQLVRTGKVARGFVGISLEELTPDLAAEFGTSDGALVADVSPDTPGSRAGLKAGDVIVKLNGKAVDDVKRLRLSISEMAPGTSITLDYLRDGKPGVVKLKLGQRPSKNMAGNDRAEKNNDEGVLNGVAVGDITPEMREQLQLPAEIKGAVVTEVDPESGSARAGLARGDVILDLNRKPVQNADDAVRLSDEIKGPKVLVRVWRAGFSRYIVVDETKP